jgi:hypothetical protein
MKCSVLFWNEAAAGEDPVPWAQSDAKVPSASCAAPPVPHQDTGVSSVVGKVGSIYLQEFNTLEPQRVQNVHKSPDLREIRR